jgi:transposase
VHKRSISYCVKRADGTVVSKGECTASGEELRKWAQKLPQPWTGALEATMFSHWICYELAPLATELRMGHPAAMKAISCGKKKSDRFDAATIADLLRCNLLPAAYVMPKELMALRQILRYRNGLVQTGIGAKNKIAGLLMEWGVEYDTRRLHQKKYFNALVKQNNIPEHLRPLLEFSRTQVEVLHRTERQLLAGLRRNAQLATRVQRLSAIDGVGEVLALTWALEIGPIERIPSIGRALSYCGLTSALHSSAGVDKRGPISKQRNSHLQRVLIEVAKLAPRFNAKLAAVHARELERGHRNRATIAVARKLVAYLMAADRGSAPAESETAAPEPKTDKNRAA